MLTPSVSDLQRPKVIRCGGRCFRANTGKITLNAKCFWSCYGLFLAFTTTSHTHLRAHRIFPLAVWNTGTGRQPLCISKMLEKWLSDGCLLLTFSLEFNAIMAVGSAHGSPWHLLCCLRRWDFFKVEMRTANLKNQGSCDWAVFRSAKANINESFSFPVCLLTW